MKIRADAPALDPGLNHRLNDSPFTVSSSVYVAICRQSSGVSSMHVPSMHDDDGERVMLAYMSDGGSGLVLSASLAVMDASHV